MKSFLAQVYDFAAKGKNLFYDTELLDTLKVQCPVISVGNLTVGGTGKTPITQMLIDYYKNKLLRPMVIGRNYKGTASGVRRVDITQNMPATLYGDEPTLLAQRNPEVPVFVGRVKWKVAQQAQQEIQPDVLLIDDGFQHRALHRDLDLLLIDATAPLSDYDLLPQGKARESFSSISRADWILITKVNLVPEEKVQKIKEKLNQFENIVEVSYRLHTPVEDAGQKSLAFAGLARPESFKQSIQQDTLYELLDFMEFPDHHVYTGADVDHILKKGSEIGAQVFLTTEKDWTKLQKIVPDPSVFRVLELKTHFLTHTEEFHAALDEVVR